MFTAGVLGGQVAAEKRFEPVGFTALAIAAALAAANQTLRGLAIAPGTALPRSAGIGIRLLSLRYRWNLPTARRSNRRSNTERY
ncbi:MULTISPECIES: hypothetical protein [unclassified Nocardia]|uniref:hypothetical protein n=1 Tax=unclassified Nocardia TaxID=2637762 RepID=UPI001CE3E09E|nr:MULTISPECIES: hypothetical protein [unclassified Nocardia]